MIASHEPQPEESRRAVLNLLEDAVQARQTSEKLNTGLRESEQRFREMIDALPAATYTTDAEGRLTHFNRAAVELAGRTPELGTDTWCVSWKLYRADGTPLPHDECPMAVSVKEGRAIRGVELIAERPDGTRRWLEPYPTPLRDGDGRVTGGINMLLDITERKRSESLIQCQKSSLELLVKGEPLERVLDFLARSIESQSESKCRVAIHLMEADGYHFGNVSAPSLPESYARATKGMDARLELGSCSSAIMAHTPTIVRDFAVETRWPAFTAEMVSLGLRGCFTTPIMALSPERGTLGTCAIYYCEPGDPSPHDQQLMDLMIRTVALAINRKQAEEALTESEQRFRTLADNISQFAWTADEKGWVYWYNQRWYDYTGTTLEEMQGWGWMKVHHPDHVERVARDVQQAWDTGEPWEDTFPLRGKNGAYRWFLTRARPIRNEAGNVIRWFGTNTDVSEQREMDDQIKLHAGQMADESRRKDEFLAMLSHELRNPLAAIRSAEHVLRGHREGSDGSTQQAARAIIQRQVGVLTKLVSDLLDVSRAISGRIQLYRETVDLNQIVRHAAETVGPLLAKCNHELRLNLADEPLWADVDPIRMEEVFVNLLNNSAKYTDDGGKIEVRSERDVKGRHLHRFRIRDNGIGIDQDLMPHIFDLFTQADRSLARSAGGLGIGLSLARRLVELHGGTIEVHSPPRSPSAEKGTEFVLNLPGIHAPESLPASELIANTAPLRKALKVLVVEDNIDQVTMLSSALQQLGHGVQTARNGLDALKIASHWQPDIMLLDIGLPGLDGYEVARRLRSDPASSRIFLIAVTGYAGGSDVAAAREAGFDAHLSKPLNFTELEQYLAAQTERPARN